MRYAGSTLWLSVVISGFFLSSGSSALAQAPDRSAAQAEERTDQQADQQAEEWNSFDYPPINDFVEPDLEIFELENGIRFYLVEDHELPLIDMRVMVRTGGVLVSEDRTGLNDIVGTVMRTGGTEEYPGDELNELLENRAAIMETSIGFSSGSARLNLLKEDFDDLIPVFVDLLRNPAFPEQRIELAKTQLRTEISRRNDDQSAVARRVFTDLIYGPESVYARDPQYATVGNISRNDLLEFHARSFVGNNLMIGVVGDFATSEMKQKLETAFSGFPAGDGLQLEFPEVNYEFEQTVNLVDKRDVNQSYVLIGHIGGLRDNPDYAKLQVMNQVLSGGFSGRLMRIVRSEMGLAYSVFGNYGSGFEYPGTFSAGVMTQSDTTAEAISAVREQIARLQEEQVSEEEIRNTKDRFLNSLVFQYTSRADVLRERMTYDYYGMDPDTFEQLVQEVRQVERGDIQDVARDYLRPGQVKILVVGNGEEIGDQLEQFGDVRLVDISIPEPD